MSSLEAKYKAPDLSDSNDIRKFLDAKTFNSMIYAETVVLVDAKTGNTFNNYYYLIVTPGTFYWAKKNLNSGGASQPNGIMWQDIDDIQVLDDLADFFKGQELAQYTRHIRVALSNQVGTSTGGLDFYTMYSDSKLLLHMNCAWLQSQARFACGMFYWPPVGPAHLSVEGAARLIAGFSERLARCSGDTVWDAKQIVMEEMVVAASSDQIMKTAFFQASDVLGYVKTELAELQHLSVYLAGNSLETLVEETHQALLTTHLLQLRYAGTSLAFFAKLLGGCAANTSRYNILFLSSDALLQRFFNAVTFVSGEAQLPNARARALIAQQRATKEVIGRNEEPYKTQVKSSTDFICNRVTYSDRGSRQCDRAASSPRRAAWATRECCRRGGCVPG
jgi:hypothetical protein